MINKISEINETKENTKLKNLIQILENKKIERIPNKFIFCSDPDRGLDLTLELLKRIYPMEKSITLDIFHSKISPEIQKKIEEMPYVKFHGKVSQERLAKEMQKADFWLYPTHFYETYCMVGLECQMAGVIPIVRKLGGLIDTVGDRGIQIEFKNSQNPEEYIKYFNEFTDRMISSVMMLIYNPAEKEKIRENCVKFAYEQRYSNIVKKWIQIIEE